MNNSFTNKNLKSENLDWNLIQSDMKNKLSLLALSLLSFYLISNSALADLRESFKNQSICTISNSQYVGSTLGEVTHIFAL